MLGRMTGVIKKKVKLNLYSFNVTNTVLLLYQYRLFNMIKTLDGDIVECGVGKGRTFSNWVFLCYDEGRQRHIWGFDSFEGFPEPSHKDDSPRRAEKGEWNFASIETIYDLLVSTGLSSHWVLSSTTLVKGFFNESLSKYDGEKIALLHIDVDLYDSYMTVLETLYDKVQRGGIIAVDEYMETFDHLNFPGAKKAIDEFFKSRNIEVKISRDDASGKYFIIKP
jgi:hypothetical protein